MKFRNILLLGASFISFVSCGESSSRPSQVKIVGGEIVDRSDAVSQSTVFLVISVGQGDQLEETYCTGSLINSRSVLTAAHCVNRADVKSVLVVFGSIDSGSKTVRGGSWVSHPSYGKGGLFSPTGMNDIAIIKLESSAPAGFSPIVTMTESDVVQNGEALILAGFGLTKDDGGELDGHLRKVSTKIALLSSERKELEYKGWWGRGACHGDSGGPAFVTRGGKMALLGITSRPTRDAGPCDGTGIYTDVRYFSEWIKQNRE